MEDERRISDKSTRIAESGSKVTVGKKRGCEEIDERSELCPKKVKMRDLESVLHKEERAAMGVGEVMADHALKVPDLEANIAASSNASSGASASHVKETNELPSLGKKDTDHKVDSTKRGGLDLNAEDVSSSIKYNDPFYACNSGHLKLKDDFECASSVGPLDENDSMRIWNEMKQNSFLSHSHGGVPVPKPRGRKSKHDGMKKKIELAKKERADKFAKIAAPSGLLNGLNPGIINHVRNSKQVHSIIEAIVRSEKHENDNGENKHGSETKSGLKDSRGKRKDLENIKDPGGNRFNFSHEDFLRSRCMSGYSASLKKSITLNSEHTGGDGDAYMVDMRAPKKLVCPSNTNLETEDDAIALKLSSSTTIAPANKSSFSNVESSNLTSVTSLTVKAANAASQWLELLHQDIRGRLAALRRSRKRVRAVIHTEFPCLFSREFSCNQENNSQSMKSSTVDIFDNATVRAHRARWTALFDKMDGALSEEEKQLESWLDQVKQMQLQCEHGLQKYNSPYDLHQTDIPNDCRLEKVESSERDLAVRAAAASIYSTCNFLYGNLPCT